jgi:hypothetical protein
MDRFGMGSEIVLVPAVAKNVSSSLFFGFTRRRYSQSLKNGIMIQGSPHHSFSSYTAPACV